MSLLYPLPLRVLPLRAGGEWVDKASMGACSFFSTPSPCGYSPCSRGRLEEICVDKASMGAYSLFFTPSPCGYSPCSRGRVEGACVDKASMGLVRSSLPPPPAGTPPVPGGEWKASVPTPPLGQGESGRGLRRLLPWDRGGGRKAGGVDRLLYGDEAKLRETATIGPKPNMNADAARRVSTVMQSCVT